METRIHGSLFSPAETLASRIAFEFETAQQQAASPALFYLAVDPDGDRLLKQPRCAGNRAAASTFSGRWRGERHRRRHAAGPSCRDPEARRSTAFGDLRRRSIVSHARRQSRREPRRIVAVAMLAIVVYGVVSAAHLAQLQVHDQADPVDSPAAGSRTR